MAATDVEDARPLRLTGAHDAPRQKALPREIFPFDVVGWLDEIAEDAVDSLLRRGPRLHGWRGSGACTI